MEGIAVYIIIGIIYIARALLKKKNEGKSAPKQPNKQNTPQQPQRKKTQQKEPESLEDLIGELFGDKPKKAAPIPEPVEVIESDPFELERQRKLEEVQKRKEREKAEHLRRAKAQEEEVKRRAMLMDKLAKESHQDAKKKVIKVIKKDKKSFDLRDAVVAKIILDRPYID